MPIRSDSKTSLQPLLDRLSDLKIWTKPNLLNVNKNKTEVIWFGKSDVLCSSTDTLGHLASCSCSAVRNMGVILDSFLKLDKQISAVVKSSLFHLQVIAKVKPYLPAKELE